MKFAKIILAALLVLAIVSVVLSGCAEGSVGPATEISDFESEKHFNIDDILNNGDNSSEEPSISSVGTPATSSPSISQEQSNEDPSNVANSFGTQSESSQEQSQGTVTGEFVVSEKKYDYKDSNLMVLNIENKTNKNFNITIKGQYLDKAGKLLKEDAVTFEGFAAGWNNNFFFVPEIAFDRFTYTLQVEEYDGDCLAQLFTPFCTLGEVTDDIGTVAEPKLVSGIAVRYGFDYEQIPQKLTVYVRMLVINNQGEVFTYLDFGEWGKGASAWSPEYAGARNTKAKLFYIFPDQNNPVWPEELKGNATVLFSITGVTDRLM